MHAFNQTFKTPYAEIIESVTPNDISNALAGSSNLCAEYLNDYSAEGARSFLAQFLQDNAQHLDASTIEEMLEDVDAVLKNAAFDMCQAFSTALKEWFPYEADSMAERMLKDGYNHYDYGSKFFLFVEQWANAGSSIFVIRALNESEAYEILLSAYEDHFKVAEGDYTEGDENLEYNDNGVVVNTDYLNFLGCVEFKKPR